MCSVYGFQKWVHFKVLKKMSSVQGLKKMNSVNWFQKWVLSLDSKNGFCHWIPKIGSVIGFQKWVLSLNSKNGFCHWISKMGSISFWPLYERSVPDFFYNLNEHTGIRIQKSSKKNNFLFHPSSLLFQKFNDSLFLITVASSQCRRYAVTRTHLRSPRVFFRKVQVH